jgi:hypothetical protein
MFWPCQYSKNMVPLCMGFSESLQHTHMSHRAQVSHTNRLQPLWWQCMLRPRIVVNVTRSLVVHTCVL